MKTFGKTLLALSLTAAVAGAAQADSKVLHVYNWSDYIAEDTLANFEKETYTAVTEARAKVGQIRLDADVVNDPEAFAKFEQAQGELGSAISRLLVAVEAYPELKATQNFRDLQVQLEGTENRIAQERRVFNESAQAFNTKRMSFPTNLVAGFFGNRFAEKSYFKAQPGAETAPAVKF